MRVAGDPDAQLPEQPRMLQRGGPGGAASLVFSGGGSLYAAGLELVLTGGAALLGIGGEVEVGADYVGYAGCRMLWLDRRW